MTQLELNIFGIFKFFDIFSLLFFLNRKIKCGKINERKIKIENK